MFRINICHIVSDHFESLRLEGEKQMYLGDKLLFFAFPFLLACLLAFNEISLKPQVGNVIKAMAIFGAFMFNLLAIIHGQLGKIKESTDKIIDDDLKKKKVRFAKEIHSNITFNILLAVTVIVFMLIYDLTPNTNKLINTILIKVTLTVNYFLLFLFFLTLIMVINRVYILVRSEN